MENPSVLKNVIWDERWNEYKPQLEKIDDCEVGPFELNPYEYTAKFCTDHNIYCPNKEICDYIDKKRDNPTNIHQRREEVQSPASSNANQEVKYPASSNANQEVKSLASSNINQEVQTLRNMLEDKTKEINLLREEIEKVNSSLNELNGKYIAVLEKLNDLNNK